MRVVFFESKLLDDLFENNWVSANFSIQTVCLSVVYFDQTNKDFSKRFFNLFSPKKNFNKFIQKFSKKKFNDFFSNKSENSNFIKERISESGRERDGKKTRVIDILGTKNIIYEEKKKINYEY